MPADFRKVNLAMQSDPDFRLLPPPAQHLYYTLWARPDLSYCGVVDWRPGRVAAISSGWTADAVQAAADCLEARHFIVTDVETEECLIRSWVRFDGLMKQPRMAVSFANAFHSVSSNLIRGVVVHEALKLKENEPNLAGWAKSQVDEVLRFPSIDPKGRATVSDPFGDGFTHSFTPGLGQTQGRVSPSVSVSPTTATTTATKQTATSGSKEPDGGRTSRGTRIPEGFAVTDEMRAWAEANNCGHVNLAYATARFVDHWQAKSGKDATKVDWIATWRNWIRKDAESTGGPSLTVVNGGTKPRYGAYKEPTDDI